MPIRLPFASTSTSPLTPTSSPASSNSSHTPETSAPFLPPNTHTPACSPNPTATSNPIKPQLQTPPSLPPACSTCHSTLPRTSYSEPRHHGYSSFFKSLNPRKLFSKNNVSMTPFDSCSPSGSSKLSKDISKNPFIEMSTFSPTNPPSQMSLSKDISDDAFKTPINLRKRKKICYTELNGSFN